MAAKKTSGVYVSHARPVFSLIVKTNKFHRSHFYEALKYAHCELTSKELKRELLVYLKKLDAKNPLIDRANPLDECRFDVIGKYAFIINHGGELPEDVMESFGPAIENIISEEETKINAATAEASYQESKNKVLDGSVAVKAVISIQDRLREKAREVAGEIEGWIDDFITNPKMPVKTVEEFVNLYRSFDLKAPHTRHLHDIFELRAKRISEAVDSKDKDIMEGYANFSKPELKKYDVFHKHLLKACGMIQEVAKAERVPRKKKVVSFDKLVAKLKYQKDDKTLGLVSMNPVQMIGAKEVWLYNTKTRKLSQYKASDDSGLSVKGASIVNFATESAEKTLRKPVEALADFKKASKVKLRTFLKDLTTLDIPCSGKVNENHIILRIDR